VQFFKKCLVCTSLFPSQQPRSSCPDLLTLARSWSPLLRIAMLIRHKVTAMFSYFVRVGAIFSCLQDFPPIL
jgi:hypothetical protein